MAQAAQSQPTSRSFFGIPSLKVAKPFLKTTHRAPLPTTDLTPPLASEHDDRISIQLSSTYNDYPLLNFVEAIASFCITINNLIPKGIHLKRVALEAFESNDKKRLLESIDHYLQASPSDMTRQKLMTLKKQFLDILPLWETPFFKKNFTHMMHSEFFCLSEVVKSCIVHTLKSPESLTRSNSHEKLSDILVNNKFTHHRDLHKYISHCPELQTILKALNRKHMLSTTPPSWLDIGEGIAMKSFTDIVCYALAVKHDPKTETVPTIHYPEGFIEDYESPNPVDLATDICGAFTYSDNLLGVLQGFHQTLKKGGLLVIGYSRFPVFVECEGELYTQKDFIQLAIERQWISGFKLPENLDHHENLDYQLVLEKSDESFKSVGTCTAVKSFSHDRHIKSFFARYRELEDMRTSRTEPAEPIHLLSYKLPSETP